MAKKRKKSLPPRKYPKSIFVVLFLLLILGYFLSQPRTKSAPFHITVKPTPTPTLRDFSFACSENKSLIATFPKGKVILHLSDGRDFTFPQLVSGSGARYGNKDESIVFWNVGDTAFMTEGEVTTYANCVALN